jgi:hypothetical protein
VHFSHRIDSSPPAGAKAADKLYLYLRYGQGFVLCNSLISTGDTSC